MGGVVFAVNLYSLFAQIRFIVILQANTATGWAHVVMSVKHWLTNINHKTSVIINGNPVQM